MMWSLGPRRDGLVQIDGENVCDGGTYQHHGGDSDEES